MLPTLSILRTYTAQCALVKLLTLRVNPNQNFNVKDCLYCINLLLLLVVAPMFLGGIFKSLRLIWEKLFSLFVCQTANSKLNTLLSQYTDVFKSEV